jgi:hypothetical protein
MTTQNNDEDARRKLKGAPARRPGQPGSTTEETAEARPDDHTPVNAPRSTAPDEHRPSTKTKHS